MKRADYTRAMRDRGWLLWSFREGRTSFMCSKLGCTGTRVVTETDIARARGRADLPKACRRRHWKGYSASLIGSQEQLQEHLRERRLRLGLSQEDIEGAGGFPVDHLGKLETLARVAQFPTMLLWAETLGYDIALIPKPLPDQVLAIIDQKAGQPIPERRPPACLLLPDGRPASASPYGFGDIAAIAG